MAEINKMAKGDIYKIDPRLIFVVDGFNSRTDFGDIDELAKQIREAGVLNPITVIPTKDADGEKYRLVDGERRYRAVMKLLEEGDDIARVPAIFLSKSTTDEELYAQQFLRNEGKQFSEYELGLLSHKLKEKCGKTIAEIAKMLGKNPGVISYALAHLERDPRIQEMLKKGVISGANVRRVYAAHKNAETGEIDEDAAVAELLGLKVKKNSDGKDKVSLKDLEVDSKTAIFKDSTTIRKGLSTLFTYANHYTNDGEIDIDIDLFDILARLKKGDMISTIFEDAKKDALKKAM